MKKFNWGDELNLNFIEHITNKKIVPIAYKFPIKSYLMIGSILSYYNLDKTIVCGSGVLTGAGKLTGKPEKIMSVRGPLTRGQLLNAGIDCPKNYGDPALLLPVFYSPKYREKKYISLIPHWRSFVYARDLYPISELTEKYKCHLVNLTNYEKWTDIIDEIAGSSFVMAESLHGLIVAETYNIPCIWVYFTNHETGAFNSNADWRFKFLDFYESIGKFEMQSVKLYEGYNFSELLKKKEEWTPGKIDYKKLLEYFPFEIKPELNPRVTEFLKNISPKQ